MKFTLRVSLLVFTLLNISCVREDIIPIKLQSEKEKLVVFGFLSPGNSIFIRVGKTQPFGSTEYKSGDFLVSDAVVSIRNSEGRVEELEPVAGNPGLFKLAQSVFPIRQGQTYHLQVESPSFETVTAHTTVPAAKALWRSVSVKKFMDESYGGIRYELHGTWDRAYEGSSGLEYGVALIYPSNESKVLQYENEGISPMGDGYAVKRAAGFYGGSSLQAVLITRDKHYAEFSRVSQLTTEVLEYYHRAVFADIISGFKGVIPEASNVENGLGVFGSYLTDSRTFYKD